MSTRKLRSAASDEGKDPEEVKSPMRRQKSEAKAMRSAKQKTPELMPKEGDQAKELVNMPSPRAEVRSPRVLTGMEASIVNYLKHQQSPPPPKRTPQKIIMDALHAQMESMEEERKKRRLQESEYEDIPSDEEAKDDSSLESSEDDKAASDLESNEELGKSSKREKNGLQAQDQLLLEMFKVASK